jgi:hypothetical protein
LQKSLDKPDLRGNIKSEGKRITIPSTISVTHSSSDFQGEEREEVLLSLFAEFKIDVCLLTKEEVRHMELKELVLEIEVLEEKIAPGSVSGGRP